ncbi:MAG: hypothetical protein GY943_35375 [Chloroflexi bacterium]|nr:hypothetical protein [Chloroflexota bacterium]
MDWQNRKISETTLIGIGVGAVGLLFSFLGKEIIPGRAWGDPMPVVLSIAQLTRGFLYWNWQSPLIHLLFLLGLAILTVWVLRFRGHRGERLVMYASRAGQITAVINVLIIALLQTDAVVVGAYYLMSGLVAVWVTGEMARFLAKKMKG